MLAWLHTGWGNKSPSYSCCTGRKGTKVLPPPTGSSRCGGWCWLTCDLLWWAQNTWNQEKKKGGGQYFDLWCSRRPWATTLQCLETKRKTGANREKPLPSTAKQQKLATLLPVWRSFFQKGKLPHPRTTGKAKIKMWVCGEYILRKVKTDHPLRYLQIPCTQLITLSRATLF